MMQEPVQVTPNQARELAEVGTSRFDSEYTLTFVIIGFALIAFAALLFLTRRTRNAELVLRTYTVTIIIFGTLLVVSSAYTTEQIAPVVGLFGTIAGYILGRSERRPPSPPGAVSEEDAR